MPVAVSPVDGQVRSMLREFGLQRGDQFAGLPVNGALAAEVVVMLGDGQQAFARNIFSAQNIFQKGDHIVPGLGTAEGDHQNRVVVHAFGLRRACGYLTREICRGSWRRISSKVPCGETTTRGGTPPPPPFL